KTCLPPWRTVPRCCSPMWIAIVSASVINVCCTSMTPAKRGRDAGAACNCAATASRSQPMLLANALMPTMDHDQQGWSNESPLVGLDSTGNNENPSRMEAVNATPSGGNQEVGGTVLVHVAHGHGIKAERISRNSAGEGFDEMTVFAGIQVRAPSADGLFAVLPGTHDKIGVTIMVDVSRHRRACAKSLTGGFTDQREKRVAVF